MSQEIRISKVGIDSGTVTDPNDMTYSSEYNTLKYYTSGTLGLNLNASSGNYEGTVAHNLGYIPFFTAYCNRYDAGTASFNMMPGLFADAFVYDHTMAYADGTNLYFKVFKDFQAAVTREVKYFIFRNDTDL